MTNKYALIGGDKRNIYLAEQLEKCGHEVIKYGFSKLSYENTMPLESLIDWCDYIICAIPFSRDNISLNTPLSNEQIMISDFLKLTKDKKIFTGALKGKYVENENLIDIYKTDEILKQSVISTVEGAIKIAIEQTDTSLYCSNVLIIGYGRIGSYLAKCLNFLGANVTIVTKSVESITNALDDNFKAFSNIELDEHLSNKSIIFNTAEEIQISSKNLDLIDKDCVYIELASAPFGINYSDSIDSFLKVIYGISLPAIVSPKTISNAMYDEIVKHENKINNNI